MRQQHHQHRTAGRLRRRHVMAGVAVLAVAGIGFGLSPAGAAIIRADTTAATRAPGDPSNLALRRPVLGSTPCRSDEGDVKAVNGSVKGGLRDKWCSSAATKTLQADLGAEFNLTSFVVRHAQAGGERAAWNTRDYDIEVSTDGRTFANSARVRGNTAAVTTTSVTARARYVRLVVTAAEQRGTGTARIYEFEAYGARPTPAPTGTASPKPTGTASPSPTATASPTPTPSVTPSKPPTTTAPPPAGTQTCFPYPAKRASFTPDIKLQAGVTLAPKYMDELKKLWQQQWPAAWGTFAAPSDIDDLNWGTRHVLIHDGSDPQTPPATYKIKASDVIAQVDGTGVWDLGLHMHEAAHGIVNPFKFNYTGAPKLYSEGITDFIRFTARGEGGIDRGWIVTDTLNDPATLDEQKVWDEGYGRGARFLLWLSQHYDPSGAEYKKVHDLNALLVSGNRDFQGVFTRIWGKSYHEMFQLYKANPKVNKHC